MNIYIKTIKTSLLMLLAIFVVTACEDEDKAPIVTFDSAGHGAYVRLITDSETGNLLINILTQADYDASQYGYSVEFIDGEGGATINQYVIKVEYDDVTGANSSGPVVLRTYESSAFAPSINGILGVANIAITAGDVAAVIGLSFADLNAGDNFNIMGEIITPNYTHTGSNSSAAVQGAAFQGHFDFTMPAACPSDLTGSYDFVTTNAWCDGSGTSGSVEIIALGGGVYTFDDFSFGAYSICYSPTSTADQPTLTFTEVCNEVFFTGFTDSYGDTWIYNSSISGSEWSISWSNTYNEAGDAVITFPGGVPFTLK